MRATFSVPIDRIARVGLIALAIGFVAACGGGGGGGNSGGAAPAVATAPAAVVPPPVVAPVVVAPVVVPPVPVGVSPNITLALNASRLTGVAPLAVTFDAIGTTASSTSLPFHEIRYSWNFGETARNPAYNATWAYGTRPGANSKDVALGPVAAHVFETPGTYTVSLTGFDGTNTSTRTTTVTVTDPNTVFSNNTIYVSRSGVPVPGQNGVPPGANVQQVTSWSAIANLANTYKRILLKRGDVWAGDGTMSFNNSARAGQGIIGAYGTGAKPRVNMAADASAIRFDTGADDWRIVDLDIVGDTVTYRPNGDGITAIANEILVLRTEVRLGRILISGGEKAGYYIVDSVIGPTTTLGYGISGYTENSDRIAVLGSRYTGSGNHGIRIQGASNSVVSNSRFDGLTNNGHAFTLRGKTNSADNSIWAGAWTENVVISDNYVEDLRGTHTAFRIHPQNNLSAERIRNVIAERNHVSSYASAASFSVVSGLTVRNNLFVTRYTSGWDVRGETTIPGAPFPTQGFFYNNTVYKPDIGLVNGFQVAEFIGTVSGQVMTNNLAYAPLDTTPIFTNGATPAQYTAFTNSSDAQMKNTRPWLAASPVTAADFKPSGSYAVGTGSVSKVWDDFMGSISASPKSIGAVNP